MSASGDKVEAMTGNEVDCGFIAAFIWSATNVDGFQDPTPERIFESNMQIVRAGVVTSQAQNCVVLREGGDAPILQEYALQRLSILDLAQGLDETVLPELAGLLGEGSIKPTGVVLLETDTNELKRLARGGERRLLGQGH